MKNKHELQADVRKGDHADRILNDPMVKEAINGMRETVYHNIRTSHHSKVDEREDLYKMLRAIDAFERELRHKIQGRTKAKSLLEKLLSRS